METCNSLGGKEEGSFSFIMQHKVLQQLESALEHGQQRYTAKHPSQLLQVNKHEAQQEAEKRKACV